VAIDAHELDHVDELDWDRFHRPTDWAHMLNPCLDWRIHRRESNRESSVELSFPDLPLSLFELTTQILNIASTLGGLPEEDQSASYIADALDIAITDIPRVLGYPVGHGSVGVVMPQVLDERLDRLKSATEATNLLLRIFRRDRLPEAIRRPAALFGGDSALEWILEGRITEVADLYDRALTF
jgi:hypothetical protein